MKNVLLIIKVFFSVVLYIAVSPVFSLNPVDISFGEEIGLSTNYEYFEDKSSVLTIKDISKKTFSTKFKKGKQLTPNYSFTSSSYWFRFKLKSTTQRKLFIEVAYVLLDDIQFFIPDKNDTFIIKKAGRIYPYSHKEIPYRKFALSFVSKQQTATPNNLDRFFYLRVKSGDSLVVPISIRTEKSITKQDHKEQYIFGIYYGLVLILIFYNFIFAFIIKDKSFIYYSLILLVYHFFFQASLNGFTYEFIEWKYLWWSREFISFSINASVFFLIIFSRAFFDSPKHLPFLDRFFYLFLVFVVVNAILVFFIPYVYSIFFSTLIASAAAFYMWLIALIMLSKGNRAARFYLPAFSFVLLTGIVYGMKTWTLLPANIYTEYSWQVGSVIQAFLLALALGDRINIIQKEKYLAQKKAIRKEKEAKVVQEKFNDLLEIEVKDRTRELDYALEELKKRDELFQNELDLAADIQKGILPKTPFNYNGINICSHYRSMQKIGGDFYEIFVNSSGELFVLSADVSGHGVPAALITTMMKIVFFEAINKYKHLDEIYKYVNEQIIKIVKTPDYITAFMISLEKDFTMNYANASHQKALLCRAETGEVEELDTHGLFIGAFEDAGDNYEKKSCKLNYGDRILIFTDGLVEAKNSNGIEFGHDKLKDTLQNSLTENLEEIKKQILLSWNDFLAGCDIDDDVSFILIEVNREYKELCAIRDTGRKFVESNEIDKAIEQFHQALKLNGNDRKALLYLSSSYIKKKNYEEAIKHLNILNELDSENYRVWYYLSLCYYKLKQNAKAIICANTSLIIKPDYKKSFLIKAYALKKSNLKKEETKAWEAILELEPDNKIALKELNK